ncbi:hypothetical protein P153DRAFT_364107 [Dothidotthia symphoricarpi CBS 119687]|uniref:Uncharacterized protein n=1 Tax=Dothidotthia symphoricarpi CBS 119687 TaxID=1392245 RepID=A0A6A6ANS5_9PLEO|nr:uncharacterized protein P153DRAFT_364107 [Dothidotthia symphoricarpi CBS 119687]KAF2132843.1 hypothetical protein P153DRAFT_364107 [Dothidotthia symphoricarpi CBS 119687]
MPDQTSCPIPEVDQALSSYIGSRKDTLRIRRALSKYLTASLRPVNSATQNQHVNHECPLGLSAAGTNPPGLKDTRLAYLHALRARNQAQTRHTELQASLEDLQQRHIDENPTHVESEFDDEAAQGYVSLLRQRRRFAELQVIQDALERLLNAKSTDAPNDPRTLVANTIGEQPDLPAERLEQLSQPQDNQTWVFKLKQQVLEARVEMDGANAAKKKVQDESPEQSNLQAQVYALERARDELAEWVSGELAKMEEETVFLEDASPIKRSINSPSPMDIATAEEHIQSSYDQYTSSRATLLDSYTSFQQTPEAPKDKPNDPQSVATNPPEAKGNVMPITKIFPHLPHIARSAVNERSLLQQSVYLQAQMSAADQEIEEALLRLSGESHLLPAGSKNVSAWSKTAMGAETATESFVKEQLQDSRQEVSSISTIVELCSMHSKVLASV